MARRTVWLCAAMLLVLGRNAAYLAQSNTPPPGDSCTMDGVSDVSFDVVDMPAGPSKSDLTAGDPQSPSQLILDVTVAAERTKILPGSNDANAPREAPFRVAVSPEPSAQAAPREPLSQAPLPFDVVAAGEETDAANPSEAEPKASFKVSVIGTSPRPALLLPMYAMFIGVQAADGYFTWVGVRRHATEVNPIVGSANGNVFKLISLKAATSASTIYCTERLRREHPRRAVFVTAAINGALSWVVWHDAQVARKMIP